MRHFTRELKRLWCRAAHQPEDMRRALIGKGALTCSRCSLTYADAIDAGTLCLELDEVHVSSRWLAEDARHEAAEPGATFLVTEWTVAKRGSVVKRWRRAA